MYRKIMVIVAINCDFIIRINGVESHEKTYNISSVPYFVYDAGGACVSNSNRINCRQNGLFVKPCISLVPEIVVPPDATWFLSEGRFTEEGIIRFIAYLVQEKKIDSEDFSDVNNIKVQNLKEKVICGNTSQIFLITSQREGAQKYLFREVTGREEIMRLKLCQSIEELSKFTDGALGNKFPILVFPEYFLTYLYQQVQHYILLMPYIEGRTLGEIVNDYVSFASANLDAAKGSDNENRFESILGMVGDALASFHQYFFYDSSFKTVRHGDFTLGNIMVDDKHVYFIDNEQIIVHYISMAEPFYDVAHFLCWSLISRLDQPSVPAMVRGYILSLVFRNFLYHYVDTFKPIRRYYVWKSVKRYVMEFISGYRPLCAPVFEAQLSCVDDLFHEQGVLV